MPVIYRDQPPPRTLEDFRNVAVAIQANLAQLKVADARRRGMDPAQHPIPVTAPGAVLRFREVLIPRETIAAYSDTQLQLRLHEAWGQYCVMCWVFQWRADGEQSPPFQNVVPDADIHCGASLEAKLAEVHAVLWRIRYERRIRSAPDFSISQPGRQAAAMADKIPVTLVGKKLSDCTDDDLVVGACEHVGMLATLRWLMDPRATWGDAALMQVHDDPFFGLTSD